jgi:hypothetical protein
MKFVMCYGIKVYKPKSFIRYILPYSYLAYFIKYKLAYL